MTETRAFQAAHIPLVCAAVALVAALIPVLTHIQAYGGRTSVLVHMAAEEPMASIAREADPDFAFVDLRTALDRNRRSIVKLGAVEIHPKAIDFIPKPSQ